MFSLSIWIALVVVAALGVMIMANHLRFARHVAREARALWSEADWARGPMLPRDLEGLPPPVRRYRVDRCAGQIGGR